MQQAKPNPKPDTAALAAALSARTSALAEAAEQAVSGIERDRVELGPDRVSSGSTTELIAILESRVNEIATDCRQLASILGGFATLAASARAEGARDVGESMGIDEASDARLDEAQPSLVWDTPLVLPGHAGSRVDEQSIEVDEEIEREAEPVSDGVRLLATQMSVAGAETGEIARRLEDDFGVENADVVIGRVFGLGKPSSS